MQAFNFRAYDVSVTNKTKYTQQNRHGNPTIHDLTEQEGALQLFDLWSAEQSGV